VKNKVRFGSCGGFSGSIGAWNFHATRGHSWSDSCCFGRAFGQTARGKGDGLIKAGSSGVLHLEGSPRSFPRRIVNSFTIDFVKRPSGSSLPPRRYRRRCRRRRRRCVFDAPRNMTESIADCSGQLCSEGRKDPGDTTFSIKFVRRNSPLVPVTARTWGFFLRYPRSPHPCSPHTGICNRSVMSHPPDPVW